MAGLHRQGTGAELRAGRRTIGSHRQDGLATTGRFALLFLLAQSILLFHLTPQLWLYSVGTLVLFAVVWYAATSRAVRRA